ncbi:uncharacterized protein LOC116425071 [Nomia melanderi]|uniref:uncharacterized protein LOC116425071 n=1 Tax=Nomia melanderi TaxID=2448451 RepID=UPI0013040076|nr:uncharacterized protein LOC116425071 [Nomia melanderi]
MRPNCDGNLIAVHCESGGNLYINWTLRVSWHQTVEFTHSSNMMKFALVVLALFAMSSPMDAYTLPRVGTGVLADELQAFVDIVPTNKIVTLCLQYLAEDAEFQKLVTYLQSPEFKKLVVDIEALPEVIDILNYIQKGGLDIYYLVNKINKFLGLPSLKTPDTFGLEPLKTKSGIRGFLDEVKALIPVDKIKALYYQKMQTSKVFVAFMEKIRSPEAQKIADAIVANPNLHGLLNKAKAAGVDVKAVKEFLEMFLGIKIPIDYIKDGKLIQKPVVPSTGAITMRIQLLAITALVAFASSSALPAFGQGPLYDDVMYFMDMIPLSRIVTITLKYAAEDREFKQLLEHMQGNEFKEMVKEIEAIPEYHNFVNYMQRNGVYLVDVTNKVNKLLGIPTFQPMDAYRTGGLKGYFEEVKSKISYDEVIHGYVYKMRTSAAFRDFVAELKSGNHQRFVNALYNNQRYLQFRNMLAVKGIDVALIEDVIYTVLGIEFPVISSFEAVPYGDAALQKDIRDFIALIDTNKVMQIVVSYLDDDELKRAVLYMYSEEFHVLVRQVEAMKEYQDLVLYLEDAGLDMFGFLQKVHKLFGMEDYVPPSRPVFGVYLDETFVNKGGLKKMLEEIIATLPMDKIKALYNEKMANSPAFKNFMEKIRSEDFKHIVNLVYSAPIFREMRAKVIAAGIDLQPVKKLIEKVLGYQLPAVPAY